MIRQRIYYSLFLALLALLCFTLRDRYTVSLFVSFLLLPFLSLAHTTLALRAIHFRLTFPKESVMKCEPAEIFIEAENNSRYFTPFVKPKFEKQMGVAYLPEPETTFSVNPHSSAEAKLQLCIRFRGYYRIGCKELEIMDFLKLFCIRKQFESMADIYVYPSVYDVRIPEERLANQEGEIPTPRPAQSDHSEVYDFRPYEQQDNIKHIHWKLSSKSEDLIVKKFADFEQSDAAIALDLSDDIAQDDKTAVLQDSMVETALSILHYYIKSGKTAEFLYADKQIQRQKVRSIETFHQTHRLGALLKFGSPFPFHQLIGQYTSENRQHPRLFILTSNLTVPLCDQAKQCVQQRYPAVLVYFGGQDSKSEGLLSALKAAGVLCLRPQEIQP